MVSDEDDPQLVHATAVSIAGGGIMIRGASGSGKSDLALRLIDRGAFLISDDYVHLEKRDGNILLSPPANLAGKLEVRSLGIIERDYISGCELRLVIDLEKSPERLPLDKPVTILLGLAVPFCRLNALEASAAIKAELALQRIIQDRDSA